MRTGSVHRTVTACGMLSLVACATVDPPRPVTPIPVAVQEEETTETPWTTCMSRAESMEDMAAEVERLGEQCGVVAGQRALTPVRRGEQTSESAVDRYTFRLDRAGTCFRVYAIGGEGVEDMALEVLDESGKLVASGEQAGRRVAAPYREPACVPAGVYTVEVGVTGGGGGYALQVWTHGGT